MTTGLDRCNETSDDLGAAPRRRPGVQGTAPTLRCPTDFRRVPGGVVAPVLSTCVQEVVAGIGPDQECLIDNLPRPPAFPGPLATAPLLRPQGVRLYHANGDPARFTRLFRATWQRIPPPARQRILGRWAGAGPWIELLPTWPGRVAYPHHGLAGDPACVAQGGRLLRFHAPLVDALPDELVRVLVAHELAHVEHLAEVVQVYRCEDHGAILYEAECWSAVHPELEGNAEAAANAWGFSARPLEDWCLAAGVARVLTTEEMVDEAAEEYEYGRGA